MLIIFISQKITLKLIFVLFAWVFFCAILSGTVVLIMDDKLGYSGEISTITSVILLKFIQPLGIYKFIMRY